MKALFVNRQRNWSIVLIILVLSLFAITIAQAQSGGATRGAASLLPGAPAIATSVPGGPGYVSLNGIDFKPFTPTDNTYSYFGVSIRNTGAAPDWFMASIHLPNGSTIKKFVVYYTDSDGATGMNLEADLIYAPLGSAFGIIQGGFTSSGSALGLLISEVTTITNPVVDLSANSYLVEVYLPNSTNVSLVGVRVDYGFQITLPAVMK
jgi:hypothetical protein